MFGIDDIIGAALRIVDKVVPDPAQKAAAALEAVKLKQQGDFKDIDAQLQQMQMQADVNKVEAGSSDKYTSRWRPTVGYILAAAFGMNFVFAPLATWIAHMLGKNIDFPVLDMATIMPVLLGMLGLGGMRSWEKVNKSS